MSKSMSGQFISAAAAQRETLSWGTLGWVCRPASTGAANLVVIEVTLDPGHGHNFHKHPDQEEAIYVLGWRGGTVAPGGETTASPW